MSEMLGIVHDPAKCWWCQNVRNAARIPVIDATGADISAKPCPALNPNEDSLTEHGSPMEVSR